VEGKREGEALLHASSFVSAAAPLPHLKATIPIIVSGALLAGSGHAFPTLHYFFVGTSGRTIEICSLEPPGLFASILSTKS